MSKSLSQFALPAVGVVAIVLAGGIAFVSRDHGNTQIAELQHKLKNANYEVSKVQQSADEAVEKISLLENQVAEISTSSAALPSANLTAPAPIAEGAYGLGRTALVEEIQAWDVDVLPDGRGLPVGSGDVFTGEEVFAEKCASCHGDFAEGVDNWPVLAGGIDTLADKDPVKTVGSYWPHLSTAWDYIHRSMPFGEAQTLSDDEVYAMVAYILYSNDLVDDDFVLTNENFNDVPMPNKDGFRTDDRDVAEYTSWRTEPCMENCKETVEITMRASVLDVTPDVADDNAMSDQHSATQNSADQSAVVEPTAEDQAAPAVETAALDAELVKAGEKIFKKCKACHQVGEGAKNRTGPVLNGIVGSTMGAVEGFKYSNAFKTANADGRVWSDEEMAGFLKKPKSYLKGTKMSFSGLKSADDILAVTEFLKSYAE